MENIHATTVSLDGRGILLRGPSGAGKSSMALRLIDSGAQLVADDRTDVRVENKRVIATGPIEIAGMMEVFGLGIVRLPHLTDVVLHLLVDLHEASEIARMPVSCHESFMGVRLRHMTVCAADVSAVAKIRLACRLDDDQLIEPK